MRARTNLSTQSDTEPQAECELLDHMVVRLPESHHNGGMVAADLWVAGVWQYQWEKVNLVTRGGNHGWHVMEGFHYFNPSVSCQTRGPVLPLMEYRHEEGRGSVYRSRVARCLRFRAAMCRAISAAVK